MTSFAVHVYQTVSTENRIEIKTKEINFSLFYFPFNYIVDRHNATTLARVKQYCVKSLVMNREMVKTGFNYWNFLKTIQENKQT